MKPCAVQLPNTTILPLSSRHVGDDFEVWIARPTPAFVPGPPQPLRVLYLLDANLYFGTATEMTRLMHALYRELPPIHIVGLAYPTNDARTQARLRTRDFTPSEDPAIAGRMASMVEPEGLAIEPSMGGAMRLLDCLVDEVRPRVAEVLGGEHESLLFGSSLGGLFAIHTYLTDPAAFDAILAVSPALWWNDEEVFVGTPKPSQASAPPLYLAVGGAEESPAVPSLAPYRMVTNARRLAARLADGGAADATVVFEELAGETHTSVVPMALLHGLRALLARPTHGAPDEP